MDINEMLKPDVEDCENVINKVKDIINDSGEDDLIKSVNDLDTKSASGLVVVTLIEELDNHEFIKADINILTKSGRIVGKHLVENNYPLDVQSVMSILMELLGNSIDEKNIVSLADMIMTYNIYGIDKLNELADKFEKENPSDSNKTDNANSDSE